MDNNSAPMLLELTLSCQMVLPFFIHNLKMSVQSVIKITGAGSGILISFLSLLLIKRINIPDRYNALQETSVPFQAMYG